MDSNNNGKTTLSPHSQKGCDDRWETAKADVHRIYRQENQSLEDTKAAIKRNYGLEACPRTWKAKLKEWGYTKNKSTHDMQCIVAIGEKRKLEGKDTVFFDKGIEIPNTRINNFKKRKHSSEVSLSVATPAAITYNTPPPSIKEVSPGIMFKEAIPSPSTRSQPSRYSVAHATLAESDHSEINRSPTIKPNIPGVTTISMLHQFLYDDIQPWSQFHLSHQLGDHDVVLAQHRDIFHRVAELVDLSDVLNISPQILSISNQLFLDSYPDIEYEQGPDTSEAAALGNIFDLTITLTEYQNKHGESALITLKQEFKLAIAHERTGNRGEAEYYCRKILDEEPQIEVQVFLGMILANTSRLEESTLLLFSAIASFIVDFPLYSLIENSKLAELLESLFIKFILQSDDLDSAPLTQCWVQMIQAIQTVHHEEAIQQVVPQLIFHGFSFAHQCSVLDILHAAKHMYNVLLKHSALYLDVTLYGIEKATAHQKYGRLLRGEAKWISSAEQVLLAFKSAANSGTHDRQLMALLHGDYFDLLPHLPSEPKEKNSIAEKIRQMLPHKDFQDSFQTQNTLEDVPDLIVEDILSDLPLLFSTRGPSAISFVAEFELPFRANEPAKRSGSRTSTTEWCSSASRKIGLTYSEGEITGISDSIWA